MNKDSKIYVAGHAGLVGSALVLLLRAEGFLNLVFRRSKELDLRRQADVEEFFKEESPEYVFLLAAKVGGIKANIKSPATFLYDNLMIQSNVVNAAFKNSVNKLLFTSSSCSYPREAAQPMKEEYLLTGKPEPTNECYAIAKIAGIKMAEAFHREHGAAYGSVLFPNIYGPGDNFDPESSHVISALIRRITEARDNNVPSVDIWGTGKAMREFLYVDDSALACLFLMNSLKGGEVLNAGSGEDVSIRELAMLIKELTGYKGDLNFDATKPDGMPRKLLDSTRMRELGWSAGVNLKDGLTRTIKWFEKNKEAACL
jgi:GDP-L-fucose synthase